MPESETNTRAVERLRDQYNATVESIRPVHEALAVFRVRGDDGVPRLEPGQYTVLGLGDWEPRVDDVRSTAERRPQLIRRAYSVSCPVLDERGALMRVNDPEWLEFYVALVSKPVDDPPPLTPRLFALQPGDRLFLGMHPRGTYTLENVQPDDDVLFCATGTGEAPHNAMLAELLTRGHRGRIVCAVCVRYRHDLAYLEVHRELERRFANYRYLPLTTREPENVDSSHPDYVGKQYLQDVFGSDRCESVVGFVPESGKAHFYLCGNPAMIGLPERQPDGSHAFPEQRGMAELLVARGFQLDEPHRSGNVHFEKYW